MATKGRSMVHVGSNLAATASTVFTATGDQGKNLVSSENPVQGTSRGDQAKVMVRETQNPVFQIDNKANGIG